MNTNWKKYESLIYIVISLIIYSETNLRYYTLHSSVADLGLFLNAIINTPNEWQRAFWGHSQPIQLLFGQISKLIPSEYLPYLLINIQNTIILGTVIYIRKNYGFITGLTLLLYCPLWSVLSYDFHFDFLSIPITAFFLVNIKKHKICKASCGAIVLITIKEIFCLELVFCGIYLILIKFKEKNGIIYGILLILIGTISFYIYTSIVMPTINNEMNLGINSDAYAEMGDSFYRIIIYIINNIYSITYEIVNNKEKIIFIIYAFGQLLFLPLLSFQTLIIGIPIFGSILLSKIPNYYSYNTHYFAGAIIPIIISYNGGLLIIENYFSKKNIFYLLITPIIVGLLVFTTFPLSRLFLVEKYSSYNYRNYISDERTNNIKNLIKYNIPEKKDLFISAQNSINYYPLYTKTTFLPFPSGVEEMEELAIFDGGNKIKYYKYADYVVLDLKKNIYLYDKGCEFQENKCINLDVKKKFEDIIEIDLKKNYKIIIEYDKFFIFRRNGI